MAEIRETSTGRIRTLEPEYAVGRAAAPKCALSLDHLRVSWVHALLRWNGQTWDIKDLGSLNGTYVDGRRLDPGAVIRLQKGSRIGFGGPDQEWQLLDELPPTPLAVPLDGGESARLEAEIIAIPSTDDPQAMILRSSDGQWVLEQADAPQKVLSNLDTFEVAGRAWRFSCPTGAVPTVLDPQTGLRGTRIAELHLLFSVTKNEEYVRLRITARGAEFDMGGSVYNYVLLTLARRRLADEAEGQEPESCGWIDVDDLSNDPMMALPQLNVAIHRIRQQFGKAGIADSGAIVERRNGVGQLRIGTAQLSVERH